MPDIKVDFGVMDAKNQANLKATKDGGTVPFIQAGKAVLIGPGHKKEVVDGVEQGLVCARGTIIVDKGSVLDKGELTVTGCRDRGNFEIAIKRISKKKIIYK